MSRTKTFIAAAVLGTGLFLAGCQSSGSQPNTAGPSTQGVACDKCKVTYVQVPNWGHKGVPGVVGYRSQKSMECPDCTSAAENFFATGKFQHACKTCGETLHMCEAH